MGFGWRQITEKFQGEEEKSFVAPRALVSDLLRRTCDTSTWGEGALEAEDRPMIGQERAEEAIRFACSVERPGYNLYVVCPAESGHLKPVTRFVEDLADRNPTPPDWVYVYNFDEPKAPIALKLKPGRGPEFQKAIKEAVKALLVEVPKTFASDDYIERSEAIDREPNHRIRALQERAAAEGMAIVSEDDDLRIVPLKDGVPMDEDDMARLPYQERRRLEAIIAQLQDELDDIIANLARWNRLSEEAHDALDREVGKEVIDRHLVPVARDFAGDEKMNRYLVALRNDILDNLDLFRLTDDEGLTAIEKLTGGLKSKLAKYAVNCFITQGDRLGAPVCVEQAPVYGELVGSLRTGTALDRPDYDFAALHPGAFHRASGGYLILDIEELLSFPFGWEVVKRTLRTGHIQIDTPNQWLGEYESEVLEPEPIPFDGKVLLVGSRYWHYRLDRLDPDYADHFKVMADYAQDMPRTSDTEQIYAMQLQEEAAERHLLPLSNEALGRLVEFAAREAEDAHRLSLHRQPLINLMVEADHLANADSRHQITSGDIIAAERARVRRLDLYRERSHDFIHEDYVKIDVTGAKVGQVNGLVVTGLELAFGQPCRITARARMGEADRPVIEQVVDILSEVDESGPSHAKGVMILGGYMQAKFLPNQPLSFSATLVFEQTYSMVDGDSASAAELCALLSAIAQVPLRQDIAMTGSVSQHGDMQAIGGVNEKIEGFFDICKGKGLTGHQGVIIPEKNISDLMLRDDVIEACRKGKFHIYPVSEVERAMEILTGMSVGKRAKGGVFPVGTLFHEVERQLESFEENRRRARRPWPAKARGK
ncbi:MAG: ATP-binding protein [Alphaproteobacteria bacterium]|nr:MAG: ATP-binding protein [Alphaproteobacteria bacterium]